MEYLELRDEKGQVANGQSPWLQFHLGQSHGYFGTSQKLNVKKGSSNGNNYGARPPLQKSLSNLEPRSLAGPSSSKQRLKVHGRSLSSEPNVSFENLWWIARNEKVGGTLPSMKPWDETKAWGRKSSSAVVLPSVAATKQTTRPEAGRTRSANNRLLGLTRANHGLPIPKKPTHNTFLEFRHNDTDKIAKLGELTRMGSSLGTRLRTDYGDNVNSGASFTQMKLKHFGVKKNEAFAPATTDCDQNALSDPQSAPQTAPDNVQRLPFVVNGNEESGMNKPTLVNGQVGNVSIQQDNHKLPEVDFGTKEDVKLCIDTGSKDVISGVSSFDHASMLGNSTLPSNGEEELRCLHEQSDDHVTDRDIDNKGKHKHNNANTRVQENQQDLTVDKISRANLSMSEFFCITVDPNSLSNSGICIYPGSMSEKGEFTSVQDDIDKKRRVRFSVTHEIHEYQPWEPIDNVESSEDVLQPHAQTTAEVAPSIAASQGDLCDLSNLPELRP